MERNELNDLVFSECEEMGQPPFLALGLIRTLSHWNQNAVIYDPLCREFNDTGRGAGATETMLQRCRWGLFQLYGHAARDLGFSHTLTDLAFPDVNVRWGVRHLASLSIQHHGTALVLAFIGADTKNPTSSDLGTVKRAFRYEQEYIKAADREFSGDRGVHNVK